MKKKYSDAELYNLIRAELIYPKDHRKIAKEVDDFFISKGFSKGKYGFEEEMLDNAQLFHVYNWSTVGASLVLALLYAYCLYRVM